MEGDVINTKENIEAKAVRYFEKQFIEQCLPDDFGILKCIPQIVTESENEFITATPSREEIKSVGIYLSGDSIGELDGFAGIFYQHYQDIVGGDFENMVRAFFCEFQLPRFVSY